MDGIMGEVLASVGCVPRTFKCALWIDGACRTNAIKLRSTELPVRSRRFIAY